MGSSTAWFLLDNPDFDGSILVIEKDLTYEFCSTSHTNSCIRQQFSTEINIRCSQFAADFVKNLRHHMSGDPRVPELSIQNYGYMYLADNEEAARALRESYDVQKSAGAGTNLLSPQDIADAYPFYFLDDIILGSHNVVDEGYWDGNTVFQWLARQAKERGAEYVQNEVVAISRDEGKQRVASVTLASGEVISCGHVVNASGPRAAVTARMAGLSLPVEPRKRHTWIFNAEKPLDRELPLTIDPSGVHVRQDGKTSYLAGGYGEPDIPPDFDDFTVDHDLWESKVWPLIATRIPQFEAIRVTNVWVGHYAYNTLDQNAVLGPAEELENFMFQNGFSGHGLQQSPAMGRGMSELITYGMFKTLDLSPFGFERILRGEPFLEKAVI